MESEAAVIRLIGEVIWVGGQTQCRSIMSTEIRDRTYNTGLETTTMKIYHEILPKQNIPALVSVTYQPYQAKKERKKGSPACGRDGGQGGGWFQSIPHLSRCLTAGSPSTYLHDGQPPTTLGPTRIPPRQQNVQTVPHTPPPFPFFPLPLPSRARARISPMQRRSRGGMGHASEPRWGVPLAPLPLLAGPSGPEGKRDWHPIEGTRWQSKRASLQRR